MSISIENRIRESTEHLENELTLQSARLKRTTRQLEKADLLINNQYRESLMLLLSNNISTGLKDAELENRAATLLNKTAQCLALMSAPEEHSIDLVKLIEERIQICQKHRPDLPLITTNMPLSLVISESSGFFSYLFEQLFGRTLSAQPGLEEQTCIRMTLKETSLLISIESEFKESPTIDVVWENSIAMCQLLLATEMSGTLEIYRKSDPTFCERLAITIPLDAM